ncbi:hypothetical protein INT43_002547, partial [Umbelopsis isabellina]
GYHCKGGVLFCDQLIQLNFSRSITRRKYASSNDSGSPNPSSPSKTNPLSPYANLTRLIAYDNSSPLATRPRVFVIGDVHGCLNELNALLDAIDYDDSTDQIIIAGDLTADGPDSLGVIRRAQEIGALCVRGNHDDKVIRFRTYMNSKGGTLPTHGLMDEGSVPDPLKFGNHHAAIATNMTDSDYDYLQSCPLILDLQPFNAYVVHGGLDPTVKINDQDPYSVLNVRDINTNGILIASDKIGDPWSNEWNAAQTNGSAKNIYYGHAAGRGLNLQQYTFGVDTGCVHGKQLTAIELHSHNLTQVNCTQI